MENRIWFGGKIILIILLNWVHPPVFTDVYTDASDIAWGVVYNENKTRGSWNRMAISKHITYKELKTILFALKCYFFRKANKHTLVVFSDNTTAVVCVNKMGSSKSELWDLGILSK